MAEMLASGFAKGLLNSIGLPILLMIAVGGMFGWRLIKDASKSMVAVGLLALVGGFALWHWWPSNGGTVTWCPPHRPDPPPAAHTPSVQPLPKYRKVEEGEPPLSWAEIHQPSIDDLHAKRMKKVGGTPEKLAEWLDPARREKVIQVALAKERARQEKAALLAKAEEERRLEEARRLSAAASRPRTAAQARAQALDMEEQRISQAQALLARVQQRHLPQPERPELAWRNPYSSR